MAEILRKQKTQPTVEIIYSGPQVYEANKNVFVSFLPIDDEKSWSADQETSFHCRIYFSMTLGAIDVEKIFILFRLDNTSRKYGLGVFQCEAAETFTTFDLLFSKKDLSRRKGADAKQTLLFVNCKDLQYPIEKNSVLEKIHTDRVGKEHLRNYNILDCKKYLFTNFGKMSLHIFDSFCTERNKTDYFIFCFLLKEGGVYFNHKGNSANMQNVSFAKPNGFCYHPRENSSFEALQFEKGHLFLQYLVDKIGDFYKEMPAARKTLFDYNDFIEKQLNVCHITLFNIENVEFSNVIQPDTLQTLDNTSPRHVHVFHEKIFDIEDTVIYLQDSGDGFESVSPSCVKAIHLKNRNYIFLFITWPAQFDIRMASVKVTMDFCDSSVTFIRRSESSKVDHLWLQCSSSPFDHPNLQGKDYNHLYYLLFDVAEYFSLKNHHQEAYRFLRYADPVEWFDMCRKGLLEWDTLDRFSSCCEEVKKRDTCIYTLLRMYEQCKIIESFQDAKYALLILKQVVYVSRKWNLFRQCEIYREKADKVFEAVSQSVLQESETEFLWRMKKAFYNEFVIYSAYLGNKEIGKEYMFIACHHEHTYEYINLLYNLKFYKPQLQVHSTTDISETVSKYGSDFHSSSTSLHLLPDGSLLLNKRFVNYVIQPNGAYVVPKFLFGVSDGAEKYVETPRIITVNKAIVCDKLFNPVYEHMFDTEFHNNRLLGMADICEGIEDIKLFSFGGKIYFLGTMCGDNNLHMVYGLYDYLGCNILQPHRIVSDTFEISRVEKNWCFVEVNQEPHFIYSWRPFKLVKLDMETHKIELVRECPEVSKYFSMARGSTSTTTFDDSTKICVIHHVDYNNGNKRHYYHSFVLLDGLANIVGFSFPFTFQRSDIEYCVGIACRDDDVVLAYSRNDSCSFLTTISKKNVLDMIHKI